MYTKSFQTVSKYKNVKVCGYDSHKEANRGFELELLQKQGEISELSKQTKIDLFGQNGTKVCYYKADFTYYDKDGAWVIEDVKSKFTAHFSTFRLKWKLVEDKYKEEVRKGTVKLLIVI